MLYQKIRFVPNAATRSFLRAEMERARKDYNSQIEYLYSRMRKKDPNLDFEEALASAARFAASRNPAPNDGAFHFDVSESNREQIRLLRRGFYGYGPHPHFHARDLRKQTIIVRGESPSWRRLRFTDEKTICISAQIRFHLREKPRFSQPPCGFEFIREGLNYYVSLAFPIHRPALTYSPRAVAVLPGAHATFHVLTKAGSESIYASPTGMLGVRQKEILRLEREIRNKKREDPINLSHRCEKAIMKSNRMRERYFAIARVEHEKIIGNLLRDNGTIVVASRDVFSQHFRKKDVGLFAEEYKMFVDRLLVKGKNAGRTIRIVPPRPESGDACPRCHGPRPPGSQHHAMWVCPDCGNKVVRIAEAAKSMFEEARI